MMRKFVHLILLLLFLLIPSFSPVRADYCDPTQFNEFAPFPAKDRQECESTGGCVSQEVPSVGVSCVPRGVVTVDPAYRCPPGTTPYAARLESCLNSNPGFKNMCCESTGGLWPLCKNQANGEPINWCKEINGNSKTIAAEAWCPDPTTRPNASGQCQKWASSGWALHYSSCPDGQGIKTGIGCIPTENLSKTGGFFLKWAFGIAGGVILVMALIAVYNLLTSAGDQQKLQAVKESISSIIGGLILIIFSMIILKVVGVDIIAIPGLF